MLEPKQVDAQMTRPDGAGLLDRSAWLRLASPSQGMTLRDWFAGQALAGVGAYALDEHDGDLADQAETAAVWCFAIADAMLAERE